MFTQVPSPDYTQWILEWDKKKPGQEIREINCQNILKRYSRVVHQRKIVVTGIGGKNRLVFMVMNQFCRRHCRRMYICEEKNLSANAMERDQWSLIRLKTWTNHLPVADSVRRIEICMGRSRVERLQHVEGRPDVSEWEGSQNNQAKLHFLKGDNLTNYESSARLVESSRRESLKLQARPSQFRLPRENLAFERSS